MGSGLKIVEKWGDLPPIGKSPYLLTIISACYLDVDLSKCAAMGGSLKPPIPSCVTNLSA